MSIIFSTEIVFCWFFTCVALGYVNLHFSLIFIPKVSAEEGKITRAVCLYCQRTQSIHIWWRDIDVTFW